MRSSCSHNISLSAESSAVDICLSAVQRKNPCLNSQATTHNIIVIMRYRSCIAVSAQSVRRDVTIARHPRGPRVAAIVYASQPRGPGPNEHDKKEPRGEVRCWSVGLGFGRSTAVPDTTSVLTSLLCRCVQPAPTWPQAHLLGKLLRGVGSRLEHMAAFLKRSAEPVPPLNAESQLTGHGAPQAPLDSPPLLATPPDLKLGVEPTPPEVLPRSSDAGDGGGDLLERQASTAAAAPERPVPDESALWREGLIRVVNDLIAKVRGR